MVSTFTPNVQLEEPARGDDVGTWDVPVNANITNLDLIVGGTATISLNNSNVVLSAAQYRCKQITFNSTLTGSVYITFPTSFVKSYEIQNLCTGTSAFVIQVGTTGANGGTFVCAPPGEIVDVVNDGINLKYKNLGRVGEYWDYAGTAVPLWVANCGTNGVGLQPLPYLNCSGASFSSATYPALATILGGTTLPDARGRTRYAADAGTGRITSVIGSPNAVGGAGGDQFTQAHTHGNTATVNDPTHGHPNSFGNDQGTTIYRGNINTGCSPGGNDAAANFGQNLQIAANVTGITVTMNNASAGSGGSQNLPPLFIGGLMMIRSA